MVERLVRNRGGIGRRIWRRRRRRANTEQTTAGDGRGAPGVTAHPDDAATRDADRTRDARASGRPLPEPLEHHPQQRAQPATTASQPKKGLFASLKGLLFPARPMRVPPPPLAADDVARAVLAVPRGVARLDAFERAIAATTPEASAFRPLALAFHKELRFLADNADLDLAVLERRVTVCAQALIAAEEHELAGNLLLRVGRKHQAAELFVSAGAIDALEETYAHIRWDEGGVRLDARLAFERFEALYLVHMREAAHEALERAYALWSDNPIYGEVRRAFLARLGAPGRVSLTSDRTTVRVVGRWPVVMGRGEEATVRLASPLLSRAHVQLHLEQGQVTLADLDGRGGTRVAGAAVAGRATLPSGETDIDMGGVVVRAHLDAGGLWLWPVLAPEQQTLVLVQSALDGPAAQSIARDSASGLRIGFDTGGRARMEPPVLVRDELLQRPTLVLEGDRLSVPGHDARWTVVRS